MTLKERAVDFLKNEDGPLGSIYQIMAAFAEMLVAEEREACAEVAERHGREVHIVPAGVLDDAKMIAASIRARSTSAPSPHAAPD